MEYTEDMLTEWFEFEKHKPTEVGVYQIKGKVGGYGFSFWDGYQFCCAWIIGATAGMNSIQHADRVKHHKSGSFERGITKWRGLKQNPAAPKKKHVGNKKKTMWIVSAWVNGGETYKHVGAFENHDNAVNAAKRYKQPRINKVRFRTPEA